jgi:hypothetical protein
LVNRNAGMGHMLALHQRGMTPPNLKDYVVESVKVGDNVLSIRASLEPWGYYKVYNRGELRDSNGALSLTLSLESSDFDQVAFAKEHPKEAAEGIRLFSLDGYKETEPNAAGQRSQTHYTFGFMTGQPAYDTVRQEFIKIASGKTNPTSNSTKPVSQ